MWKEVTACHFFHDKLDAKVFGVGSIWTVYACVNSGLQKKYDDVDMNSWKQLRKMLVNLTRYYVPKKSNIISKKDFKRIVQECFDSKDPMDLQAIVTISQMYCGLLRQNEVHKIMVKNVKVCTQSKNMYVDFD